VRGNGPGFPGPKMMMRLSKSHRQWLADTFGQHIRFQEPMARHTSLKVGGPADAYVHPQSRKELLMLFQWLQQNDLPYFTIGNGTNLLVLDSGIRGIVISLKDCLKGIHHDPNGQDTVKLTVGAATRLSELCRYAIRQGFRGMNFAVGIPGTLGGAIVMNAGTGHGSMADIVTAIEILSPEGDVVKICKEDLSFHYRGVAWKRWPKASASANPIILEALLGLSSADPGEIRAEADRFLKNRKERQPLDQRSAGSFFKNPETGKTAGELIDLAGLKGLQVGEAQVSEQHANWIINKGGARAADILALKKMIQATVLATFKIKLETEVQIVGA